MNDNNKNLPSITLLMKPFIALTILMILGTIGYMKIEGWNVLDSLLMSLTTLTTVGYGFIHPLTRAGKIFTIIYIFFGVILFLYIAAEFAKRFILFNFRKILSKKNMESRIKKMKDHYIVCGYGRTGAEICTQLNNNKLKFIIIDNDPANEQILDDLNFFYLIGDATDDNVLNKASIEKAKGFFCSLSDDADNLYLTLSAKNLNPDLSIVSRCIKASNEPKFRKAGATNVVLPYEISGRRMVSSVVKPFVIDFLDVVLHTEGQDLELKLEQYNIKKHSFLSGETIISSELRQKTGVIIIAIKRGSEFITNPSPNTVIQADDYLITLGTNSQLNDFEKLTT